MISNPTSGLAVLIEWANGQDHWIRFLVSELINSRIELHESHVDHFYDLFLKEKELRTDGTVEAGPLGVTEERANDEEPLVITSLKDVESVNALASKQEINFHPLMTILYGENATGKTGYVRILKRIAAVRTSEPILPDVRQINPSGAPSATISYRLGDEESTVVWHDEEGVNPLTRMDIFDARAAPIHVDEELTYVYTPADLALFPRVHRAVEQVKARLDRDLLSITPKGNSFLPRFGRDTRIYPKIESLSASTDLDELQTIALVTKEEEGELESLRMKVDALRSSDIDARREVARAEAELHRTGLKAITILSKFSPEQYQAAVARLTAATERHNNATRIAFATYEIPGALGSAWRQFIEAGERYVQEFEGRDYPSSGDSCVYCHQSLGEPAVTLVKKYRDFLNDALRKAVDDARENLDKLIAEILEVDLGSLDQALSTKLANGRVERFPALTGLLQLVAIGRELQIAGKQAQPFSNDQLLSLATVTLPLVETHLNELDALVTALGSQIVERKGALERESTRLRELEARLALRALLPDVIEYVDRAKWANKAGTLIDRFPQIAKSLTEAAKIASEHLLNQDFETLFEEECQQLRAPRVTLDFPGRRGEPARRKSLVSDHKLSEILSEGEQKVIALADFIAEARLRKKASPIVFDDPVTSLDYRRMPHVVDRLIELAKYRQVVVFTHNIWFTTDLLSRLEKGGCAFYAVTGDAGQRGVVAAATSPRTDSFSSLRARINQMTEDAAKEKGETQSALIEKTYDHVRAVCEIIVETEFLAGVTERFQPVVRLTKLPQIRTDRLPAATAVLMPIYEKACRYIAAHSQPMEMLNIRPTLDELKKDWKDLQEARQAYLKD